MAKKAKLAQNAETKDQQLKGMYTKMVKRIGIGVATDVLIANVRNSGAKILKSVKSSNPVVDGGIAAPVIAGSDTVSAAAIAGTGAGSIAGIGGRIAGTGGIACTGIGGAAVIASTGAGGITGTGIGGAAAIACTGAGGIASTGAGGIAVGTIVGGAAVVVVPAIVVYGIWRMTRKKKE